MRDTRLVQTAVLRHPRSDEPVLMPMDRWDALALRAALANRSLWCGHLLGGCGRQLTTKIGRQRVPHFAHFPDPEGLPAPCRRTNTDASSADHLFIHAGIKDLLHRDGRRSARVRFDGEFDTGGTCHWITIDLPEEQGVIVVALRGADLSDWQEREQRLRSSAPWVSWLFGPGLRAPQRLLHRDGFAMHLLFDNHRPGRPLQLGTQLPETPTEWIALSEARFGDNGLTTPASARAHCAHREQPAAPVPAPPSADVSAEPAAPAPVPPPAEVSAEPAASPRTAPRMMTLDNGMELPVPELRVLLGRIAQKYGFAEDPVKVRLIAEHARALRPDVGRRVEFPSWLQRDIDAALGVQSKHADEDARPLDPGPTVDQLPLPDAVVTLVRELGWDPAADPLRTRWLKLACAHSSYLYEHREIGVEPNVLNMLQELGKRWLTLAVLDSFALEYRAKSAGEQSQVLARLRHTLFDLLASAPDFTNHLLLGRGEALMMQNSEYQAKTRVKIDGVLQICGTLALLGGIDSLYDLVRRWYPQVKDAIRSGDGATDAVDWKTALNQLEAAIVFDTTPSGPDHDRQFIATVSNGRGRTGRGTGRSKKAAERAAAEDFVRTHAPAQATRLIASMRTSFRYQVQVRPRVLPREHHPAQWYAIDAARKLFDLPSDADPYLTQALIHSSWAYENQRAADQAKQRDNTVLAHHGSAVVDALTAQRRAEHILASTLTPNADDARITTPVERIWREAFAASPMAHGLFLGKGEQKDPSRAFANAMQAVLAVAWRFRGQDLLRTLPRELTRHADRAADGSVDHYTRLVESCRPFGLELEETYRVSGPDHLRSFECTIRISSLSAGISAVGAAAQSKTLSKQRCAQLLLGVLETISGCDEWKLSADEQSLAKFLLESQLTQFSKVKRAQLSRLLSRGALGTTYLLTDDIEAFAAWAQQVEDLTGGLDGDQAEELHRFYVRCLAESGGRPESRKPLRVALERICQRAREPELSDADRDLIEIVHRVVRASREHDDREGTAVAEALQWIIAATDRRGGRIRVQQEPYGFALTVTDAEPSALLDPFVPLLRAQFPSVSIGVDERTITICYEPVPGAQSILQAGALALEDSSVVVGQHLHEQVWFLREAVAADDREAIETAVADLTRRLTA